MTDLIKEGDNVVFRKEDSTRVFQVRRNRQIFFGKTKFHVDELFGLPYGSRFEVDRGKMKRIEESVNHDSTPESLGSGKDNRNLTDSDSNQKFTRDDIEKMKEEGVSGEEIIQKLIEGSETFKTKTEFSQAKFLKKKKNKHMLVFTVHRPTTRFVLEVFAKEPTKICFLRADSLSQMLSFSNVSHGHKVAVLETCQGLLLSCFLHRLGGKGAVIQLTPSNVGGVQRQVLNYFDFTKEELENVYSYPLDELNELNSDLSCVERLAMKESVQQPDSSSTEKDQLEPDTEPEPSEEMDGEKAGEKRPWVSTRLQQRKERAEKQAVAGDMIRCKQLDSLIIASKYNPTPVLMNMLEYMAPSRPVVVYSQYLDPLVECYSKLKQKHAGVQLKLSETWQRNYQVLEARTHPLMNMSGTGGYLLTFTTTTAT